MNLVKLLAGNYNIDVNSKSHGGYTPLHLACQFGRQEVFDLLVKAYGADPRIRDNHGKTPRQYMMAQEQSMGLSLSNDTFRQLKDRRRIRRQVNVPKLHLGIHVMNNTMVNFLIYGCRHRRRILVSCDSGPSVLRSKRPPRRSTTTLEARGSPAGVVETQPMQTGPGLCPGLDRLDQSPYISLILRKCHRPSLLPSKSASHRKGGEAVTYHV